MAKENDIVIEVEENEDDIKVTADEVQIVFTDDHTKASNRDAVDQHPIRSIIGLLDKLKEIDDNFDNVSNKVEYSQIKDKPKFKTINGESIVGEGNIIVEGSGGSSSASIVSNKLAGLRLSILGDSISTFGTPNQSNAEGKWTYPGNRCRYPQSDLFTEVDNMYWKILLDKTGMKLGINDSWAGSCVANTSATDSGDVGPNRCISSLTRITHLGENGTPDVIIVYGGTNDIGKSMTLGTFDADNPIKFATLSTTPPQNPASLTEEQIADLDVSTFANAYVATLVRLQKLYPDAIIICMTPNYCKTYYGTSYKRVKTFTDMMVEICDYFGVVVVDTRKVGIGVMDMSDDTYTSSLPDGIHPGVKGHKLMAEYLFNVLDSTFLIPNRIDIEDLKPDDSEDTGGDTSGGNEGGTETPVEKTFTWHTTEVEDHKTELKTSTYIANPAGYGWAQVGAYQDLIRGKKINAVKFVPTGSSGTIAIGKTASQGASTGTLLATKSWDSSNVDSNGVAIVILDEEITITGTEFIVFSYGSYGTSFKYCSGKTSVSGFYGRIPQVPSGGTGSAWSDATAYSLGIDYGYYG